MCSCGAIVSPAAVSAKEGYILKKTAVDVPKTLTGKIALNLPDIEQWMASGFSQTEILGFLSSRGVDCTLDVFRHVLARARKKAAKYGGRKNEPLENIGRYTGSQQSGGLKSGGNSEQAGENKETSTKADIRQGVVFVPERAKKDNYQPIRLKSDLI
jgi:hypothetical protein